MKEKSDIDESKTFEIKPRLDLLYKFDNFIEPFLDNLKEKEEK